MDSVKRKIGIVGLGLIGGSISKAIKENTEHEIYGFDIHETTFRKALLINAIDGELTDEVLTSCDIVIVSLYPNDTIDYIKAYAHLFKKGCIVIDCCGVKEHVCDAVNSVAATEGFIFIGGHPMAGLEHSGFEYSKKALFDNASMILTPSVGVGIEVLQEVKGLFLKLGFTNIQVSTAKEHDEIIAFSSQLAHVVSSAYIKSPAAMEHKGFSAGSYKDLTRVAKLNEHMWTELFLENRENLANEIDGIIERLAAYSSAIKNDDADTLRALLKDGREKKALIDGEIF
jgi:prephenate dehydrogenase